jgi:TPR repeat protein
MNQSKCFLQTFSSLHNRIFRSGWIIGSIGLLILAGCGSESPSTTGNIEGKNGKADSETAGKTLASDEATSGEATVSKNSMRWKVQAESGDRLAQFQYYRDLIQEAKEDSKSEALTWLRKASEQGLAEAQFELGKLYLDGEEVEKNTDEGIRWLKLAAKQNFEQASNYLSLKFPNQVLLTKEESKLARETFDLAVDHLIGRNNRENSPQKAVQLFLKAAEIGSLEAKWNLGLIYKDGIGVERNMEEARRWFEVAAGNGHPLAQYNLGLMYLIGSGGESDLSKSIEYFTMSAEAGNPDAAFGLGELYLIGDAVTKSEEKALNWFMVAAEAGHPRAQSNLGTFYIEGIGVEKNEQEAFKWFNKAAQIGEPYGLYNLGFLYESGETMDRNLVEAFKCYSLAAEILMKFSTDFGSPLDPLFYKAKALRDDLADRLTAKELQQGIEAASRFIRQKFEENRDLLEKSFPKAMSEYEKTTDPETSPSVSPEPE